MPHGNKAVYYAINDSPKYVSFAIKSIESLRKHNSLTKVYLFIFGSAKRLSRVFLEKNNVKIVKRKKAKKSQLTFLKWLALKDLSEERLLFVDADTIFFDDVNLLFERFGDSDFYARQELCTYDNSDMSQDYRHGSLININTFSSLVRMLHIRAVPIFNTGVMLFNHSISKKINLEMFESYRANFESGKFSYPCTNRHILEEIVTSLVLGNVKGLNYSIFGKEIIPFFVEWKLRAIKTSGIVMHIWTKAYPLYQQHRIYKPWLYEKQKTLTEGEMKRIDLRRKRIFASFKKNNVCYADDNLYKPYLKALSPGCLSCIQGTWSCTYINALCTRKCFFCPQMKSKDSLPNAEGIKFSSVNDYLVYLKRFNFDGIGFSGGETFLAFNRLLEHIRKVRAEFGPKHYIWAYTNGDLVTEKRFRLLREAGLNELRFDLAARGYDLKPLTLATKYIDVVTVEIPAIPEHLAIVKSILGDLERIGVKYLNLHQLLITRFNYELMKKRGYAFINLNSRFPPVLESELCAFEIMLHAIKINSKLGINYCSTAYKHHFQEMAFRKRYSDFCKKRFERTTSTAYIRKLSTPFEYRGFNALRFFEKKFSINQWLKDGAESEITFDQELLAELEELNQPIRVTYYTPVIGEANKERCESCLPLKINQKEQPIKRFKTGFITLQNNDAKFFFRKLFIEHKSLEETAQLVLLLHGLGQGKKKEILRDLAEFKERFKNLEYMPTQLQDYDWKHLMMP